MGDNSRAEDSLLEITARYLELVFNLETKRENSLPSACIPEDMKRGMDSDFQVRSRFVLDTIANLPLPKDAAVAICLTRYDLYPAEDWNFVFGQASLSRRVGVWSFYRYGDANDTSDFKTVLKRTLKVASHETGHMFSIGHCIRYECDLNGSNSMGETDASPMYYCPDCLEKLSWNIGFELEPHFAGLMDFYKTYGFTEEAQFMQKNLDRLKK